MDEKKVLAEGFEANRPRLQSVAYRMLGSRAEADDAVQETWLKLSRADAGAIENFGGWLTTVVARVCLDILRSRRSKREKPLDDGANAPEPVARAADAPDHNLILADSIGVALLVVLETLEPAERVAFVLHDMFDIPFDEIAPIVGRTPTAARQLASRARRRVRGAETASGPDRARQREIVEAFFTASRENDFAGLLAVLDPDVVLHADPAAVAGSIAARDRGAPLLAREIHGATEVARAFAGRAGAAQAALIDGSIGMAWAPGGQPRAVHRVTFVGGKIARIDLVADPETVGRMDIAILAN